MWRFTFKGYHYDIKLYVFLYRGSWGGGGDDGRKTLPTEILSSLLWRSDSFLLNLLAVSETYLLQFQFGIRACVHCVSVRFCPGYNFYIYA